MKIREAVSTDNAELLRLMRGAPMSGTISLRIDREPDFFGLASLRGRGKTFVATDSKGLIACFSVTEKDVYIGGSESSVGYFADLRVQQSARGRVAAFRMLKKSLDYAIKADSEYFYMVVSEGNDEMISMLTGRAGLPKLQKLGSFNVYSLLPRRTGRLSNQYTLSKVSTSATAAETAMFVNRANAGFLLAPVLAPIDFTGTKHSDKLKETAYIARFQGRIVASATSSDSSAVKTNTVLGLPWHLKIVLATLRLLKRLLPVPHMPKVGESIRVLFIKNYAVDPEHDDALRAIVAEIRKEAFSKDYSFVTVGVHENDPRQSIFKRTIKFNFRSILFIVPSGPESSKPIPASTVPMVDFSLG